MQSQGSKSEGERKWDWKQTQDDVTPSCRDVEGLLYQGAVSFVLYWNTLPQNRPLQRGTEKKSICHHHWPKCAPTEFSPPNFCDVAWPIQYVKPALDMQTDQSGARPHLSGCAPQAAMSLCFTHPRSKHQTPRDHPYSRKPHKTTQTSQAGLLSTLLCLSASWTPGVFPCDPLECAVPLASRTSGHNKVCCWFFPEPFLYLLLWPHLTKHLRKRYKTNTKLSARHYNEYIHVISVSVAISIWCVVICHCR